MANWTRLMLKLFSELLQASRYSEGDGDAPAVRQLCAQSSRILEPMVRCLVDWVKSGSTEDQQESLQYV